MSYLGAPKFVDRRLRPSSRARDVTQNVAKLDALEAAGVDLARFPEAAQVRQLAEEAAATLAAFGTAQETGSLIADMATQIVGGRLDPAKSLTRAAALDALQAPDGTAVALRAAVRHEYARASHAALVAPGDRWITDGFRPVFDTVTADLPELVAALPEGVVTDLTPSARHDRKVREAWGRVEDTIRILARLYYLSDGFREAGFVPLRPGSWSATFRFADPVAVAGLRTDGSGTTALVLTAVRRGALPTILTQREADALSAPQPDPIAA